LISIQVQLPPTRREIKTANVDPNKTNRERFVPMSDDMLNLCWKYADTKMKREAIEKATNKSNPLISYNMKTMWQDDESMIKRLYGLI